MQNDREKLAKITNAAPELKLTDPSLAVNIRNLHSESGIQNLGALRTTSIQHLLTWIPIFGRTGFHRHGKNPGLP